MSSLLVYLFIGRIWFVANGNGKELAIWGLLLLVFCLGEATFKAIKEAA